MKALLESRFWSGMWPLLQRLKNSPELLVELEKFVMCTFLVTIILSNPRGLLSLSMRPLKWLERHEMKWIDLSFEAEN